MGENAATELCELLSEQLLPALATLGEFHLVLAQPSLRATADIAVRKLEAPPLPPESLPSSRFFLAQWKQESMHAVRYPYFCCVLAGEAEMRLSFPMRRSAPRAQTNTYQIVTLRPPSLRLAESENPLNPNALPHSASTPPCWACWSA